MDTERIERLRHVERMLESALVTRVMKGKKTQIGDVVNWAGVLFVRVDDQPGAGDKVNFRKLGKAPAGWQKGDPHPYADKVVELLGGKGETPDETPADETPADETPDDSGKVSATEAQHLLATSGSQVEFMKEILLTMEADVVTYSLADVAEIKDMAKVVSGEFIEKVTDGLPVEEALSEVINGLPEYGDPKGLGYNYDMAQLRQVVIGQIMQDHIVGMEDDEPETGGPITDGKSAVANMDKAIAEKDALLEGLPKGDKKDVKALITDTVGIATEMAFEDASLEEIIDKCYEMSKGVKFSHPYLETPSDQIAAITVGAVLEKYKAGELPVDGPDDEGGTDDTPLTDVGFFQDVVGILPLVKWEKDEFKTIADQLSDHLQLEEIEEANSDLGKFISQYEHALLTGGDASGVYHNHVEMLDDYWDKGKGDLYTALKLREAALLAKGNLDNHVKPGADDDDESVEPDVKPPVDTTTASGFFSWAATPSAGIKARSTSLKMDEKLGGSTGARHVAGTFVDDDGKEHDLDGVFKVGGSAGQAQEEHLAHRIYDAAGLAAPKSFMSEVDGKSGLLAEWMNGQLANTFTGAASEAVAMKVRRGFAADALLANWDVAGADMDNILVVDGEPVRIDNGGALRYRAMGADKGAAFGNTVGELETMRDPSQVSGKIFHKLTDKEVAEQIKDLGKREKAILDALKDHPVHDTIKARLAFMKKWAANVEKGKGGDGEEKIVAGKMPLDPKVKNGFSVAERKASRKGVVMPKAKPVHKPALTHYQGGGYKAINAALRKDLNLTTSQKSVVAAVDDYLSACPEYEGTITRNIGSGSGSPGEDPFLTTFFKGSGVPQIEITSFADKDAEMIPGFTKEQFIREYLVGQTISEKQIVSSSKVKPDKWAWNCNSEKGLGTSGGVVQIVATGKTRGADLNNIPGYVSGHKSENEITLQRGQRYKIKDVKVVRIGNTTVLRVITDFVDKVGESE